MKGPDGKIVSGDKMEDVSGLDGFVQDSIAGGGGQCYGE